MEYFYLLLLFSIPALALYAWLFTILKLKKQKIVFTVINLLIEALNYFVSIVYYQDLFGEDKIGLKGLFQFLIVLSTHTALMFIFFIYLQRKIMKKN